MDTGSGPLLPSDTSSPTKLLSTEPAKMIIVPLDYVRTRVKIVRDDVNADEEGLVALSKAAEYFLRKLARNAATHSQGRPINYDDIADAITHESRFSSLQDFFPKRVTFGSLTDKLNAAEDPSETDDDS